MFASYTALIITITIASYICSCASNDNGCLYLDAKYGFCLEYKNDFGVTYKPLTHFMSVKGDVRVSPCVVGIIDVCERDAHTFGTQFARWYDYTQTTSHHLGYGRVKFKYVMVDMCTVYDYSLPRVLNGWSTKKNLMELTKSMFGIEEIDTNEKTIILNCTWHIGHNIDRHFDYTFKKKKNLREKLTSKRRNLVKCFVA